MKLLVVTLLIAVSYSQAAFLFQQEWISWKDYHGLFVVVCIKVKRYKLFKYIKSFSVLLKVEDVAKVLNKFRYLRLYFLFSSSYRRYLINKPKQT